MRTLYKTAVTLAFVFSAVLCAAGARGQQFANAPELPSQLDKGWNLISVPCDISLDDFRQGYGHKDLKAYTWDGGAYAEVEKLERGKGYFINANEVLNPSSICKPQTTNSSFTITLAPGWNLIGNPYHRAVTFEQFLGKPDAENEVAIYEVKKNKVQEHEITDNAKPWEGYWVYTSEGLSAPVVNTCEVTISAYGDEARKADKTSPSSAVIGGKLYFKAMATMVEGPNKGVEDVTATASWGLSNAEAGGIDDKGVFTASATGTTDITASYCGATSPVFTVNVYKELPVTHTLEIFAYGDSGRRQDVASPVVKQGQKVYFTALYTTYTDGQFTALEDVTASAAWVSSSAGAGVVDEKGVFTGEVAGKTDIFAEYEGATSTAITVKVIDLVAKTHKLVIAAYSDRDRTDFQSTLLVVPGGKAYFTALYYTYIDGVYSGKEDITASAAWVSSAPGVGVVGDEGVFTGAATGVTGISAAYEDAKSTVITLNVIDPARKTRKLVIAAYSDSGRTNNTASPVVTPGGKVYFTALYYTYLDKSIVGTEDVTARAGWVSSATGVGALDSKGVFIAAATGAADVSAGYGGATSPVITVAVKEKIPVTCDKLYIILNNDNGAYFISEPKLVFNPAPERCSINNNARASSGGVAMDCYVNGYGADVIKPGDKLGFAAYCLDKKKQYYYDGILYSGAAVDVTKDVEWTSDNEAIAAAGGNPGEFTGKTAGAARITASYMGVASNSAQFRVMNVTEKVSGIKLYIISGYYYDYVSVRGDYGYDYGSGIYSCLNSTALLYSGVCKITDYISKPGAGGWIGAYKTATRVYSDGTLNVENTSNDYFNVNVAYKSSAPEIITVTGKGLLTAGSSGITTITGTYNGSADAVKIVVTGAGPVMVSMEPANGIGADPGKTAKYKATVYYIDNLNNCVSYYGTGGCLRGEDVTTAAAVTLAGEALGSFSGGVFTSNGIVGKATATAEYKGLKSNGTPVSVMHSGWMVVTAEGSKSVPNCPAEGGCYYLKAGEKDVFKAYGRDTASRWATRYDITNMAKWEVSDSAIAEFGAGGELSAKKAGMVWIRATVGDARSDKVMVMVVTTGSKFMMIGALNGGFKPVKPLKVGDFMPLQAVSYSYITGGCYYANAYNPLTGLDERLCKPFSWSQVEARATWKSSAPEKAKFGVGSDNHTLEGISPGFVDLSATYDGLTSNALTMDIWNERDMKFCDDADINSGEWHDEHTRATLELNCKTYNPGEPVYIRYTAEVNDGMRRFLDNCLDLYIMDDNDNIVRTLREEGCSTEPITKNAARQASKAPDYQTLASWDMKDKNGNIAPPGKYYAVARFYILWEPVIRLPIDIIAKQ